MAFSRCLDMVRSRAELQAITPKETSRKGNLMPRKKIIIDTDPGQDDAVAILLALAVRNWRCSASPPSPATCRLS
jgi:hypothetical protein